MLSLCVVNATTRANPFDGCRQEKRDLQRMEDHQVIRCVDKPTYRCAGMVVVAKPRVVVSTVEGEEKDTHKVRIYVDLTKLNESVMRENMTYHMSTNRLVGWREQRCSQSWMLTPGFGKFPSRQHPKY